MRLAAAAVAFVAAAAFAVYSNVLYGPFLFDDNFYIVDNKLIRDLGNFTDLSGTRYVGLFTFALNYWRGGLDPFVYHLFNVIVHAACSVFVFRLVLLTMRTPAMAGQRAGEGAMEGAGLNKGAGEAGQTAVWVALFAALLFATHPVQTQAVAYISQRFASLATLFYLMSLVIYVRWRLVGGRGSGLSRGKALYVLSVVLAVLAMKTKEISFTLPIVILLYDFAFFPGEGGGESVKDKLRRTWPFLLTLLIIPLSLFGPGAAGGGAAGVIHEQHLEHLDTLSPWTYILTQSTVVVKYLRLLILPVGQNVDYDYPIYDSLLSAPVMGSLIFLTLLLGFVLYAFLWSLRKTVECNECGRWPLVASFGALWFFLTLSIESSVIPLTDVIFEHRLYLPNVGAATCASALLFYLFRRFEVKRVALATAVALLVVALPLGVAAHKRNEVWADDLVFWTDIVRKSPAKLRPHYNLGIVYQKRGMSSKAAAEFKETVLMRPGFAEGWNNLGFAHVSLGKFTEAIGYYNEALRIDPEYAKAMNNLGVAHYQLGEITTAERWIKAATVADGTLIDAWYNLAVLYKARGRGEEAVAATEELLRLDPSNERARELLKGLR